jgi:hypothetical protein
MTPHERINLGRQADSLMNDPAFAAARAAYEADLFRLWKEATEVNAREQLWHECRALKGVTERLSALKTDGDVARNRSS